MRIKDFNDEPHFLEIIKLIPSRSQINTLFDTNYERKRRICDRIIHKAMRITVDIHQTNKKLSVTVQPKKCM